MNHIQKFARDEEGACAVEYAVVLAGVIVAFCSFIWVAVQLVDFMATAVEAVAGGGDPPPPTGGGS